MKKLKPLFFAGTASDVGKSIITAGFCRILKQDGYSPAPFKAQNMSLNSFATPDGFEIGRAQAVQAEAACIPCSTDMNPVLLKPTTDTSSQIVLHGKPWQNQSAYEYFAGTSQQTLFDKVCCAFDRLNKKYNPIVMEGAGSIAEINLKHRDIVNMRMAHYANANVYLIADIERGGVFANVYGTIQLLPPEERKLVKGIIINKFRGDSRLFDDGKKMLEDLTHIPIVGILPYFTDIFIDEEDSVVLQTKNTKSQPGKINIAVVVVKQLSNFTDFALLEKHPNVHLYYANMPEHLVKADIIILPGSKSTIADLQVLQQKGIVTAIHNEYRQGKTIIGICGGYQMLGLSLEDPMQIESNNKLINGIGLLPIRTTITNEKTTRQTTFFYKNYKESCSGYEIHMGITTSEALSPLNALEDGTTDGFLQNHRCWGTYMHGILDNPVVLNDLLKPYLAKEETINYRDFKNEQYNKLANFIRGHVDLKAIYEQLA